MCKSIEHLWAFCRPADVILDRLFYKACLQHMLPMEASKLFLLPRIPPISYNQLDSSLVLPAVSFSRRRQHKSIAFKHKNISPLSLLERRTSRSRRSLVSEERAVLSGGTHEPRCAHPLLPAILCLGQKK